jgi:hypothetical protein
MKSSYAGDPERRTSKATRYRASDRALVVEGFGGVVCLSACLREVRVAIVQRWEAAAVLGAAEERYSGCVVFKRAFSAKVWRCWSAKRTGNVLVATYILFPSIKVFDLLQIPLLRVSATDRHAQNSAAQSRTLQGQCRRPISRSVACVTRTVTTPSQALQLAI